MRKLIIFLWLIFCFSFAGVEIIKRQNSGITSYFFKFGNTEYRIIYLPTSMDNPRIMDVLRQAIFSDNPVKYRIAFDDFTGQYQIYINNSLLFSFDKRLAFILGYSDVKLLLDSYSQSLSNLNFLPEVFFEKNYIEVLVNQRKSIRIYNKSGRNFTLNIPDYCYYTDGKLYIFHDKPVLQQAITLSYDGTTDISYITIKIPTIDLPFYKYVLYYKDPIIFRKIDLFRSFVLPNLIRNTSSEITYKEYRSSGKIDYDISTSGSYFPYADVTKRATVELKRDNILTNLEFDYLIISNNPEKIEKRGIIYNAEILDNSGYWIWFHHLFMADLNYCLEIENEQNNPCDLEFYLSYNTSKSEVETGIKTSIDFYNFLNEKPVAKTIIHPQQKVRLMIQRMSYNQVITGFIYLKSSGRLRLRIFVFDRVVPSNYLSWDGTPRVTGKFPKPIVKKEYNFDTSKGFYSIRIPDKEIISNNSIQNYSNYGVFYSLLFIITNSYNYSQNVNIYFSSISGYTPFVFMSGLNIFRVESGLYRKIFEINLGPRQTYYYPINFVITPGIPYPIEFEISTTNL